MTRQARLVFWLLVATLVLIIAGSCLMLVPPKTVVTISGEPTGSAIPPSAHDWIDDDECIADECCSH